MILPVVLYGCETWTLTLREEHRLRVFKNRMLRIFGHKREKVAGGWRRLHNEELHSLYTSPMLLGWSGRMRWVGHAACMEKIRNAYNLVGTHYGRRPLERPGLLKNSAPWNKLDS
jgi:hypothetical protein